MMHAGLLKEAESLYPYRHLNALQTVGYRELFEYMDEKTLPTGRQVSLDKAVEKIKKNTRNFAKRQITWFKKLNSYIGWECNRHSRAVSFSYPFIVGTPGQDCFLSLNHCHY